MIPASIFATHGIVGWLQLIGISLGVTGILVNAYGSARSRDLQVTLGTIQQFYANWQNGWRRAARAAVRHTQTNPDEPLPEELMEQVFDILNYVDWMGRMIADGHVKRPKTLLFSVAPVTQQLIDVARPQIEEQMQQSGAHVWSGLVHFERLAGRVGALGKRSQSSAGFRLPLGLRIGRKS